MKFTPKSSVPNSGNHKNRLGIASTLPQISGYGGMITTSPCTDFRHLQRHISTSLLSRLVISIVSSAPIQPVMSIWNSLFSPLFLKE